MHLQRLQQAWTSSRPVTGRRELCITNKRVLGRNACMVRPVRLNSPILPRLSEVSFELGASAAAATWFAAPESNSDDRVMLAVEEACSLVHLQVIISQYEGCFQVQHWLTAILRLPELISADGEYDSFTQVQRLLHSFESRTFSALGSFSSRQLISIISTYSQLSYTPSSQWLSFAVAHLLPRLDALSANPADLCALITALAKLQFADCAAWQQMYTAALPCVHVLSALQVATLATALATVNCDNSTLMSALSSKVADDLTHLSTAEIAQLACSFSSIGERSPRFWKALGDVCLGRLHKFAPAQVAGIVRSFAAAGHYHCALFNGVASAVLMELRASSWQAYESMRGFDVKALGDILWAFKVLRIHDVALLTAIVRHVGARAAGMRASSVNNEDLQRWVAFVQKQHSDYFMYGFFLSVATGVVLDQMLGATLSFVAAWWVMLRPMITDAAAGAYVQYVTRKGPWGGVWASILFNVEDAFRAPAGSGRF